MPIITVQITDEEVTPDQKSAIMKGATALMTDILGKDPNTTFVVIEEVALENWGIAGLPVTEFRKRLAAA